MKISFTFLGIVLSLIFVLATTTTDIDHWETLVYSNDCMKYKMGDTEPQINWNALD